MAKPPEDWGKPPPLPRLREPVGEPFPLSDTPPSGMPTLVGLPRPGRGAEQNDDPGPREMAGLIRGLRSELVLLRESLPPQGPSVPTTPVPPSRRQALAQAATKTSVGLTKYYFLIQGALGFAEQLAAAFKPELVEPLQKLRAVLSGLF